MARQFAQHARGIGRVFRFAVNGAAECHSGVGTQNRCGRQLALAEPLHGGVELERGHPLHIAGRRLAALHRFQCLGVFPWLGQQQFVAHAKLLQQLAPARALGGEVDEARHSGLLVKACCRRAGPPQARQRPPRGAERDKECANMGATHYSR